MQMYLILMETNYHRIQHLVGNIQFFYVIINYYEGLIIMEI